MDPRCRLVRVGCALISFDYLHSARPELLHRLLEIRIPVRLQGPLWAICGALVFVLGAWSIEAYRLNASLGIEATYQREYEISRRDLARTNVYYDHIRSLVTLDKRVRAITTSGDDDALRLAEIANSMPQQAWLTAISRDDTGITLDGNAQDLTAISRTVQGLAHARDLRDPTLISAARVSNTTTDETIKYTLHVKGVGQ